MKLGTILLIILISFEWLIKLNINEKWAVVVVSDQVVSMLAFSPTIRVRIQLYCLKTASNERKETKRGCEMSQNYSIHVHSICHNAFIGRVPEMS